MKHEVKQKWLAALRSGEYKQGRDALCNIDNEFCCLGVLCDIFRKETNNGEWSKIGTFFLNDDSYVDFLPTEVAYWAGLEVTNPTPENSPSLSYMNDHGSSFATIADIIERNF